MKIGTLASFGHNLADSLASGICFMAGVYSVDVFGEASSSREGHVTVDFLTGSTTGSPVSDGLCQAIRRYAELLPALARKHGVDMAKVRVLSARFGTDPALGPHFAVTAATADGRSSVDQYVGIPGKRFGKPRRRRGVA